MKQLRRNNHGEQAITLISLVITIIVLLILAGVTIITLTGDNGILSNTTRSKEMTEIEREKEQIKIAVSSELTNQPPNEITKQGLENELNQQEKVKIYQEEGDYLIEYLASGRAYQLKKDGQIQGPITLSPSKDQNPGDITKDEQGNSLAGTEDDPYQINCIEDLVKLSTIHPNSFANQKIELMRNLNFTSELSYVDYTTKQFGDINQNGEIEELMIELTTGKGFSPIKSFNGHFDGNHYEIQHIFMKSENEVALFSSLYSTAIVENLGITGQIESEWFAAGITVSGFSKDSLIRNCYNKAKITGVTMVGGIASQFSGTVDHCQNYGDIYIQSSSYQYGGAGGIIGTMNYQVQITNCINYAKVSGNYRCGGIAGTILDSGGTIKNSENRGIVESNATAGGIVGVCQGKVEMINVANKANVKASGACGGLLGVFDSGTILSANIQNSVNLGTVESTSQGNVGGIIGYQSSTCEELTLVIKNCYQVGDLITTNLKGGIIGKSYYDDRIVTTISLDHNYYLNTTATTGINAAKPIENMPIAYDINYMKSQEFLTLLNQNRQENSNWAMWKQENNDFPILDFN